MPDDPQSHIEGQMTMLQTAIVVLACKLLSNQELAEFHAELEEIVVSAAEETSPLRQTRSSVSHTDNQSFLLGISERAERMLDLLTTLTDNS